MKPTHYYYVIYLMIAICFSFKPIMVSGQNKDSVSNYVTTFIADFNSSNWADKLKTKYGWNDEQIQNHRLFREAFPDYQAKVKHVIIDGEFVLLWGEMSGTFTKEFS